MSLALLGAGPGTDGSAAFTPASVSGLDFWVEAGDTAHIYIDAGSTPVTTDGQAVQQWNDKSSAARNVSTSGTAKPLYKTDLAKPSLKFDGVDDALQSATSLTWTDGSGQMWFAIAIQSDTTNQREVVRVNVNAGTAIADIYVNTQAHMEMKGSAGFEEDASAASTIAANTPYVIIGTVTSTTCEVWVDNVSNGAHTNTGTPSTGAGYLVFGNTGTAWAGRVFAICHGTGTLSSTDRGNLQTYLAALHP